MMMSRRYELLQTGLSGASILLATLIRSDPLAVALAVAVIAIGLVHVGLEWRRERVAHAQLAEEETELRWMLVPGPGA
jgi:hypothetical protein